MSNLDDDKKKKKKKKKKTKKKKKPTVAPEVVDNPPIAPGPQVDIGHRLQLLSHNRLEGPHLVESSLPTGSWKSKPELPSEYLLREHFIPQEISPFQMLFGPHIGRVYTTIPPLAVVPNYQQNPDGWTECIFDKPHLKKAIYSVNPNFPLRIPRPTRKCYRLETLSRSGVGMVASLDIGAGELIASERPLLVIPASLKVTVGTPALDLPATVDQRLLIILLEQEKTIQIAFDRMLPEAQAAYKKLANSHLEDGSGPLLGIARTNGFGIKLGDEKEIHTAVYDHLSRVNHSCVANAAVHFNKLSFCGELRALRDLKAGEEILVSYYKASDPLSTRQAYLQKYGFTCSCQLCTSSTLQEFQRRAMSAAAPVRKFLANPNGFDEKESQAILDECLSWIKQIEEVGLVELDVHGTYLMTCITAYQRLKRQRDGMEVFKKWKVLMTAMEGVNATVELERVVTALVRMERYSMGKVSRN